jgi:hypothetical protein
MMKKANGSSPPSTLSMSLLNSSLSLKENLSFTLVHRSSIPCPELHNSSHNFIALCIIVYPETWCNLCNSRKKLFLSISASSRSLLIWAIINTRLISKSMTRNHPSKNVFSDETLEMAISEMGDPEFEKVIRAIR